MDYFIINLPVQNANVSEFSKQHPKVSHQQKMSPQIWLQTNQALQIILEHQKIPSPKTCYPKREKKKKKKKEKKQNKTKQNKKGSRCIIFWHSTVCT